MAGWDPVGFGRCIADRMRGSGASPGATEIRCTVGRSSTWLKSQYGERQDRKKPEIKRRTLAPKHVSVSGKPLNSYIPQQERLNRITAKIDKSHLSSIPTTASTYGVTSKRKKGGGKGKNKTGGRPREKSREPVASFVSPEGKARGLLTGFPRDDLTDDLIDSNQIFNFWR